MKCTLQCVDETEVFVELTIFGLFTRLVKRFEFLNKP